MVGSVARIAGVVVLVAAAAACAGPSDGGASRTLVVSAAASLAVPFGDLAADLEARRPGLDVQVNLGSSATLAGQIVEGAPAGVFASAAAAPMELVGDRAVDVRGFAADDLVLAVPAGNPGRVGATADLARPELRVGLCAPGVPCGDYGRSALQDAGVTPSVDTEEPDAGSLLAKVRLGELDVAVLYRTQVRSAGPEVELVELSPSSDIRAVYLIAALRSPDGSSPSDDARAFVDLVLGPGSATLRDAGYGTP
ncbi:MAG: molybdate ABC transporter substrate-binding protein [Actinomycetota bacterium]